MTLYGEILSWSLMGDKRLKSFFFNHYKSFWPLQAPLRLWFPLTTKFAFFLLSFILFKPMMLLFSPAYQHLLSDILQFLSIIFPFTYIPVYWYVLIISYYPINLSWSDVWFWLPIQFWFFFCSVNKGWQPNW